MTNRRFDERPHVRRPGAGRPRKSERTNDGPVDAEIIGAAATIFAKKGVTATTMAEIAEAVGLGVSSIYYYFNGKHAILERIVEAVNSIPLTIADQVCAEFDDAPRRLHAFIRRDAAALCHFPFDINEIHRLAGEDRETFDRYWADRQRLLDHVVGFLRQGIDDGAFERVDPHLTALTLLSNDEAVQNWYRPPRQATVGNEAATFTPEEIGGALADLAVRGLLADPRSLDSIRADTEEQSRPGR